MRLKFKRQQETQEYSYKIGMYMTQAPRDPLYLLYIHYFFFLQKTNDDAIEFDYTVLLHEFPTQVKYKVICKTVPPFIFAGYTLIL